jgi:hypothetical protein
LEKFLNGLLDGQSRGAKLRAALEKDRAALVARGYDAIWSFWDKSAGAEAKFIEALRTTSPIA